MVNMKNCKIKSALYKFGLVCLLAFYPFAHKANANDKLRLPVTAESQPTTAKLTQIRGRVVVNLGSTYQVAEPNMVIPTGAKIMAVGQSSATLVYKEGCAKEIQANSQVIVGAADICGSLLHTERQYVAEVNPGISPVDSGQALLAVEPNYVPATIALLTFIAGLSTSETSNSSLPDLSPD